MHFKHWSAAYWIVPLAVVLGAIFVWARTLWEPGCYSSDRVGIDDQLSRVHEGHIAYRTLRETLFYSPGVLVDEDADPVALCFVRCSIFSRCAVDVRAVPVPGVENLRSVDIPMSSEGADFSFQIVR